MGKFSNKILQVNIDELRENPNNARTHSESQIDKISASILKFGFVNPVLIDDERNIIAGHGRVQGAKRAGLLTVPCVLIDYS